MLSDMPDIMSTVDKKNISAGESPISFENLGAVMYDGSNIANVELPVRYVKDSNNVTKMVPDSKLSKRIEEAQKEIDSLPVKDINTIREIYAAHDIETNYQGKPIYKYQKFLIFDAVVGEEVLDESNIDNSFFEDADNEMTKNIFNQRYEYGSKSATKTNKRSVPDRDKYWLLPGQKALKKTQVALPISDITVNAAFADRNKLVIPKSQRSVEYMRENAAQQTGTRTMNEPSKSLMVSEGSFIVLVPVNGEATGPQMLSDMPDIMSIVDKKNVSAGESSSILFDNLESGTILVTLLESLTYLTGSSTLAILDPSYITAPKFSNDIGDSPAETFFLSTIDMMSGISDNI